VVAEDLVARNAATAADVQDVNQVAVHRNAVRELPASAQDLLKADVSVVGCENRQRPAKGVDGKKKPVRRVENERALRGKMVYGGTARHRPVAAGRDHLALGKTTIAVLGENDHLVTSRVVRLDENGVAQAVARLTRPKRSLGNSDGCWAEDNCCGQPGRRRGAADQ
jgi:hypothetical protein